MWVDERDHVMRTNTKRYIGGLSNLEFSSTLFCSRCTSDKRRKTYNTGGPRAYPRFHIHAWICGHFVFRRRVYLLTYLLISQQCVRFGVSHGSAYGKKISSF